MLERWQDLARRAEAMAANLPASARPAYFQLVEYPACAGAAMAEKMIVAEQARRSGSKDLAARAEAALRRIEQLTERYNTQCDGKWRGMMNPRPRKLPVFDMPPTTRPATAMTSNALPPSLPSDAPVIDIDVTKFVRSHDRDGTGWRVVNGLGRRGAAIALFPRGDIGTLRSVPDIRAQAPIAEYAIENARAAEVEIIIEALPTHPVTPATEVIAAVSIDDAPPLLVRFDQGKDDERDATWQANVLRGAMFAKLRLAVPAGGYALKLWGADPAVVIQRISVLPR